MMTQEQLLALYDECGKVYTREELKLHGQNRSLKSELEIAHAYNHEAMRITQEWLDYVNGTRTEQPDVKIWRLVRPGHNLTNSHCLRLRAICEYFAEFDYQECPLLPIFVYCSRSSMTLLSMLAELFDANSIECVQDDLMEIFALVANRGPREMTSRQYRERLMELCERVVRGLDAYANELGNYIRARIDEKVAPMAKPATKADVNAAVEKTGKTIRRAKNELAGTIVRATQGGDKGCHHPRKDRDRLVQQVIQFLAAPGVVFSINNACIKVAGKKEKARGCKLAWLYAWCHEHEKEIKTQVEVLRAIRR